MERINPRNAIQLRRPPLVALVLFAISTGQLTVDRRNQNFIAIPGDINPNVTILQLGSNRITRVEQGDLVGLLRLEELYMGHNEINFISQAAFMNIKKLFKIVMSSITLPEFPSGFAGAWSSIVNLDIRKGTFIKQTVQLTAFPVLESVVFNNNQIELEMVYLPNLNTLHATDCGMDTFPDLSRALKLKLAQLNKNNFTEIPQSALVGLTKLTKFMFIGCRVRYLPDLSHLVSLQILKAHTNYLMSFPDLYHLPLTTLTLSNNPICYVTNHCAGYECGTVLNEQSRCLMSTVVTHKSIWGLH